MGSIYEKNCGRKSRDTPPLKKVKTIKKLTGFLNPTVHCNYDVNRANQNLSTRVMSSYNCISQLFINITVYISCSHNLSVRCFQSLLASCSHNLSVRCFYSLLVNCSYHLSVRCFYSLLVCCSYNLSVSILYDLVSYSYSEGVGFPLIRCCSKHLFKHNMCTFAYNKYQVVIHVIYYAMENIIPEMPAKRKLLL